MYNLADVMFSHTSRRWYKRGRNSLVLLPGEGYHWRWGGRR